MKNEQLTGESWLFYILISHFKMLMFPVFILIKWPAHLIRLLNNHPVRLRCISALFLGSVIHLLSMFFLFFKPSCSHKLASSLIVDLPMSQSRSCWCNIWSEDLQLSWHVSIHQYSLYLLTWFSQSMFVFTIAAVEQPPTARIEPRFLTVNVCVYHCSGRTATNSPYWAPVPDGQCLCLPLQR